MKTYSHIDDAYQDLLRHLLTTGERQENRTGIDTLKTFGWSYQVSLSEGFPLLGLRDLGGGVWESIVAELLWYLSGEHHIENLKEHTSIWNEWADEDDNLEFAYGRFWREYPIPECAYFYPGEEWVSDIMSDHCDSLQFDQISYILDTLKNNRYSRRMVLNAWHPANCSVANPPACHCMAVFNVTQKDDQKDRLNCHLTMRSNDVYLGHPFNIAQYALLTHILADLTDYEPGKLQYSGADVHLYIGDDEDTEAYDQLGPAREILDREPTESMPSLSFPSRESIDDYRISDFSLSGYDPHDRLTVKTVP